jgi:hypothetical protein
MNVSLTCCLTNVQGHPQPAAELNVTNPILCSPGASLDVVYQLLLA